MHRLVVGLIVFFISLVAVARDLPPGESTNTYYGKQFYQGLAGGLSGDQLRTSIYTILSSTHSYRKGGYDQIGKCQVGSSQNCYQHRVYNYKQARVRLFGDIYLEWNNEYLLRDVYCNRYYGAKQLGGRGVGPGIIPNAKYMNTEHAWPQSRFSRNFRKRVQKSDLFILYPVSSRINSVRSNIEFGEVFQAVSNSCEGTKRGFAIQGSTRHYFEPPDSIKGDMARSLFYFSVRYKMPISAEQEYFLRRWHRLDPVDAIEIMKQEKIYDFQAVRNPFIDHPSLVSLIPDL